MHRILQTLSLDALSGKLALWQRTLNEVLDYSRRNWRKANITIGDTLRFTYIMICCNLAAYMILDCDVLMYL